MDMSAFDGRKQAEEGVFVALKHPYTGEPFAKGKEAPGFYVRGLAARSVQSRLAEMQREAKQAAEDGDDQDAAMERLHENLIDNAMKYIIRADDAMTHSGQAVGDEPDMIRKVLDSTFPEMRVVKDGAGSPIMQSIKITERPWVAKTADGEPFALFGAVAPVLGSTATPWMVATDRINEYTVTLLRVSRDYVRATLTLYPCLRNHVHDENTPSKRYLAALGFELSEPFEWYTGAIVREFKMERSDV